MSQHSQYVHQEIGVAEGLNKLIVPLVEVGIDSNRLAMLESREYIPFDKHNPYFTQANLIEFLKGKKTSKERSESIGLGIFVVSAKIRETQYLRSQWYD